MPKALAIFLLSLRASFAAIPSEDLRVRDPFILPDPGTGIYYLYRQIANGRGDSTEGERGVQVFTSSDLKRWEGPTTVFAQPADFWADAEVWAPEVHMYQGKYYLFVTFTANRTLPGEGATDAGPMRPRGTQILVADSPLGPFRPFANRAHTPETWMSLDGTLWIEEGVPWMVFCREWHQVTDGTMELVRLAPDLSAPVGEPRTLFRATDGPWVLSMREAIGGKHGYVTDGPWIHRTRTGKLLMIWSSFGRERYAIGIAESKTGRIDGPWGQQPDLLVSADGGHGMIFRTFEGQLTLVFHQPNLRSEERMRFFALEDTGDTLRLSGSKPDVTPPSTHDR
jgi:beta-xylosidase